MVFAAAGTKTPGRAKFTPAPVRLPLTHCSFDVCWFFPAKGVKDTARWEYSLLGLACFRACFGVSGLFLEYVNCMAGDACQVFAFAGGIVVF